MKINDLKIAFQTIYFYSAIKISLVIINTEVSSKMFLSIEDVERLTGCKRKSQQCIQLDKMRINYFKNARGEPVVTEAILHGLKQIAKPTGWHSNAKML